MEPLTVLDEKELFPNVVAVSSLCDDNRHVLFLDFDVKKSPGNLRRVENCISGVVDMFGLSCVFVFETRGGYNGVCFDKFIFNTVATIKSKCVLDCRNHLVHGINGGGWKFRLGSDKKFVSSVGSVRCKHPKSNAHRLCFNGFFGLKVVKDVLFDDSSNVLFDGYWCWKESVKR